MKIDILCEGRLNKNIENDICNLYINRIISLKKSGILKVQIKKISSHQKYKVKSNKNTRNKNLRGEDKPSQLNISKRNV